MTQFTASFIYRLVDRFSGKAKVMGRAAQNLEKNLNRSGQAFERFEGRYLAANSAARNSARGFRDVVPPDPRRWDKSSQAVERFSRSQETATRANRSVGRTPIGGGNVLFGGILAGVGAKQAFDGIIGNALTREFDFASVEKVLADGTSEATTKGLFKGLNDLTKVIPAKFSELGAIMEAAAQSGIKTDDLLGFTEFTGKAATAFDMDAGSVGTFFAQTKAIFRLSQEQLESYGDSVNALSNTFNAQAGQILQFANRGASGAQQLGLTATQLNAVGAAMVSLGSIPETAGRAFTQFSTKIKDFTLGSKRLEASMKKAGLNPKDFRAMLKAKPEKALLHLFESIRNAGDKGFDLLKAVSGENFIKDFGKLAKSPEELARALALVADKTKFAGSVSDEFAKRASTNKAKIELMFNSISAAAAAFGANFTDSVGNAAKTIAHYFNTSDYRVSIFEKISTAYKSFIDGFRGDGFSGGKGPLAKTMDFIFGDASKLAGDTLNLSKIGANFKSFGEDVRSFANMIGGVGGAISSFFGSVEKFAGLQAGAIGGGAGKFVAWALGISVGAKILLGVAGFAARITGLTLLFSVLKGAAKITKLGTVAKSMVGFARAATVLLAVGSGKALIGLVSGLGSLTALAFTPVGAAILGIATAMGAVYAAYQNWDEIVKGVKALSESLGNGVNNIIKTAPDAFGKNPFVVDGNKPANDNKKKPSLVGKNVFTLEKAATKAASAASKVSAAADKLATSPLPATGREAARPNFQTEVTATVKSDVHGRFDPARIDVDVNVQGPGAIPITVNGQQQGTANLSASSNQPRGKNLPISTTTQNGGATSSARAG